MSAAKKHARPNTPNANAPRKPDADLSETLDPPAPAFRSRLARATAEGALRIARERISQLEEEVAQLRAEAQWREGAWTEERATLRDRLHQAELRAARADARVEEIRSVQMDWEVERQLFEEQVRHITAIHNVAEQNLAALYARLQEKDSQISSFRQDTQQLQRNLFERERVLGAMWQTLKDYRALSPMGRLLQRPPIPSPPKDEALRLTDQDSTTED